MNKRALPNGIKQKSNGKWAVTLTTSVGSTQKITKTFDTLFFEKKQVGPIRPSFITEC